MLSVIIVAAGASSRFQGEKQLTLLNGLPLFLHSVREYLPMADAMVVAVPRGRLEEYRGIVAQYGLSSDKMRLTEGGGTRTQSVRNALAALDAQDGIVAIHDAARPLAKAAMLAELVTAARQWGGAAPGVPSTDTLLLTDEQDIMVGVIPRQNTWRVATPQVFQLPQLREAYANLREDAVFTDDTQVFHAAGGTVKLLLEKSPNPKVTYPGDLPVGGQW